MATALQKRFDEAIDVCINAFENNRHLTEQEQKRIAAPMSAYTTLKHGKEVVGSPLFPACNHAIWNPVSFLLDCDALGLIKKPKQKEFVAQSKAVMNLEKNIELIKSLIGHLAREEITIGHEHLPPNKKWNFFHSILGTDLTEFTQLSDRFDALRNKRDEAKLKGNIAEAEKLRKKASEYRGVVLGKARTISHKLKTELERRRVQTSPKARLRQVMASTRQGEPSAREGRIWMDAYKWLERRERGEPHGLYVFVPAYNEQKTLEKVLTDLVALKNKGLIAGICVVNDASEDRTGEIADKFEGQGVKVIHNEKNSGKADCFYQAVKWAHERKAEYFAMFDADLKGISESQIRKLKTPLKNQKIKMSVGRIESEMPNSKIRKHNPDYSGQRIIRMSALKPLSIGNKNWVNLITGLQKDTGQHERRGYGLEQALNYLVGKVHGREKGLLEKCDRVAVCDVVFKAGQSSYFRGRDGRRSYRVGFEPGRMRGIIGERVKANKALREKRGKRILSTETLATNKRALEHALKHRKPR